MRWVLFAGLIAAAATLQPNPDKILPWTSELEKAQPDDAFAAVYARRLIFMGAHHANRTDSLTFKLINDAYAVARVDTLIEEGFPYSWGPNPKKIIDRFAGQTDVGGFVEAGEIVPSIRNAVAHGAKIWGGEPDDADIRDALLSQGFSREDLIGFYTLRSIPQWLRERRIDSAADQRVKALVEGELSYNRQRLALASTILPDFDSWTTWYRRTNGKAFGSSFSLAEAAPLADAALGSNRIAAAIGRARDTFLLRLVARHLDAGERVIVVFGESHLMVMKPALDDMLGTSCYVGAALREAPSNCLP